MPRCAAHLLSLSPSSPPPNQTKNASPQQQEEEEALKGKSNVIEDDIASCSAHRPQGLHIKCSRAIVLPDTISYGADAHPCLPKGSEGNKLTYWNAEVVPPLQDGWALRCRVLPASWYVDSFLSIIQASYRITTRSYSLKTIFPGNRKCTDTLSTGKKESPAGKKGTLSPLIIASI